MTIPTLSGIIRRRVLLNYRVSPDVVEPILPSNFRPKLVKGFAVAGICLIRLEQIRPKDLPGLKGISSENTAHRIAVEWEDDSGRREGVFIPRRHTNSRLNALAGGRLFPGVHQLSKFEVSDSGWRISIRVSESRSKKTIVELSTSEAESLPPNSIFSSLEESSAFFKAGCLGYSARPDSALLDGLLLKTDQWKVTPLNVHAVHSAYFDDRSIFPSGTLELDHASSMRDIPHEWHAQPVMNAIRGAHKNE